MRVNLFYPFCFVSKNTRKLKFTRLKNSKKDTLLQLTMAWQNAYFTIYGNSKCLTFYIIYDIMVLTKNGDICRFDHIVIFE